MTPVPKRMKQAMQYLGPIVEERIARYEQYGRDDPDRPVSIDQFHIMVFNRQHT